MNDYNFYGLMRQNFQEKSKQMMAGFDLVHVKFYLDDFAISGFTDLDILKKAKKCLDNAINIFESSEED